MILRLTSGANGATIYSITNYEWSDRSVCIFHYWEALKSYIYIHIFQSTTWWLQQIPNAAHCSTCLVANAICARRGLHEFCVCAPATSRLQFVWARRPYGRIWRPRRALNTLCVLVQHERAMPGGLHFYLCVRAIIAMFIQACVCVTSDHIMYYEESLRELCDKNMNCGDAIHIGGCW